MTVEFCRTYFTFHDLAADTTTEDSEIKIKLMKLKLRGLENM